MSMFNPRGIIGVIGVILALIALYLILERAGGATQVLGSIASGSIGLVGALQGRNVAGNGVSVSGSIA